MPKICNFPYPIDDLSLKSIPYFRRGHGEVVAFKKNTLFLTKMAAKWLKSMPYLWLKWLKNHTVWGCTYLYSPCKGVTPPYQPTGWLARKMKQSTAIFQVRSNSKSWKGWEDSIWEVLKTLFKVWDIILIWVLFVFDHLKIFLLIVLSSNFPSSSALYV